MLLYRNILALVMAFAYSTAVNAQDITLKSTTSSVEIVGKLISFDNEFYVIETALGELEVDARTVSCTGEGCPKIETTSQDISIIGDHAALSDMFVPLLEAYGSSLGATLETTQTNIKVLSNTDVEFANINIVSGTDSNLEASTKNSLVLTSGTNAQLRADSLQTSVTPLSVDALVAIVAETNPVNSISQLALRSVLSGTITNWNELGGPDANINLYLPSDGTPNSNLSTRLEFPLSATTNVQRFESSDELVNATKIDPFGLGFTNYADKETAKTLSISGSCGAVIRATPFNFIAGSYPSTFYHYLKSSEEKQPIFAREFIEYLNGAQAKSVLDQLGNISLSIFERDLDEQGNRLAYGILTTENSVSQTDFRSMIDTLNGGSQLSTVLRFGQGLELDSQSDAALNAFITQLFLGNYADQKIMLLGFSDSIGDTDENNRNSKAAALLVSTLIKEADEGGILEDLQMEIHGFGEASPLACEDTPEGLAINNRVEIWIKN